MVSRTYWPLCVTLLRVGGAAASAPPCGVHLLGSWTVHIAILGPLRVVDSDGADVTPRGAQQRRLLSALAAAGGKGIGVDDLEELLWPQGAPSANALQAAVSKLRRVIGPASVDGDGRSYVLSGASIDLVEFDAAITAARWTAAESLVSGRPFPDLDDAGWARPLRARVEADLARARAERLSVAAEGESPAAAVAELELLTAREPLDERWWSMLMIALYRSGRRSDALEVYQRARRILVAELGLEPSPSLRRTEERVLAGADDLARPAGSGGVSRSTTHLPARIASFVGRELELAELGASVASQRLVTLVGPGGTGKTTLALELARRRAGDVTAALLAAVDDRAGVVRAVARAAGVPDGEQPGLSGGAADADSLGRLASALRLRDLTVVLDNCEHVVEPAAELAHELLTACPDVRIVATSREPLGVPGELVYRVPPLPIDDAIALFRGRVHDHGVDLTDDDESLVAGICRTLDGLPLAIELAAARVRSMSVAELADALVDRFAVLSTGPRAAEARQRTLRAVVDWSHDLLDDAERAVFRRFTAFAGGATAAGLQVVCSGPVADGIDLDGPAVVDIVARLVDKSLVQADRGPDGVRFTMLQTLHDYAAEQLTIAGERETVVLRHARYVADALAGADRGLVGHGQATWFALVATERDNINAALGAAVASGDAQLALDIVRPIGWYFFMSGELSEGVEAFRGALGIDGPTADADRAVALALYGWLLSNGMHVELALAVVNRAFALIDRVGDPWKRGLIANIHAMGLLFAGHLATLGEHLVDVDEFADTSGDAWLRAITDVVVGEYRQLVGEADEARRRFERAAEVFEQVGDRFAYALAITEASELLEQIGDYDAAAELLERGITIADEMGFSGHPLAMRARLGNVEILRGDLDAAERHHRSMIDDVRAGAAPWVEAMARLGLAAVARRRGRLDEAEAHLGIAWDIPRTRAVPYMRSLVHVALGYLADQRGDFRAAFDHQAESLEVAIAMKAPRSIAYALEGVAGALALSGDIAGHELGARLLGCAHAVRLASGGAMPPSERFDVDRAEHRLRAVLGDEGFDRQFVGGEQLVPEQLALEIGRIAPRASHR